MEKETKISISLAAIAVGLILFIGGIYFAPNGMTEEDFKESATKDAEAGLSENIEWDIEETGEVGVNGQADSDTEESEETDLQEDAYFI